MDKYKGYLINNTAHTYAETYHDGHRNEPTGNVKTVRYTEVINPRNGKRLGGGFENVEDAKQYIDTFFSKSGKARSSEVAKEIKSLQKTLQKKEKERDKLRKKIFALQQQLPPKEWF